MVVLPKSIKTYTNYGIPNRTIRYTLCDINVGRGHRFWKGHFI